VLLPECLSSRPVGVELELLAPVAVPAIMPLTWDFSARWFASFGGADQHQPEQGRNRRGRCRPVPVGRGARIIPLRKTENRQAVD